jgi:hypothetical protein
MRARGAPNSAASLCLGQDGEISNLVRDLWHTPDGICPGGTTKQIQTLSALFSFPGFRARSWLQGIFGDPHARQINLVRRKNRRVLGQQDSVPDLLLPQDAPSAGHRCRRLAHLFGVYATADGLRTLSRSDGGAAGLATAESPLHATVRQQVGILCRNMSNKPVAAGHE